MNTCTDYCIEGEYVPEFPAAGGWAHLGLFVEVVDRSMQLSDFYLQISDTKEKSLLRKQELLLFDLILYVPVNNFSFKSRRVFLG